MVIEAVGLGVTFGMSAGAHWACVGFCVGLPCPVVSMWRSRGNLMMVVALHSLAQAWANHAGSTCGWMKANDHEVSRLGVTVGMSQGARLAAAL